MRNAKAKGRRPGRARVAMDAARITALRAQGLSWAKIGERLSVVEGTARRIVAKSARIPVSAVTC